MANYNDLIGKLMYLPGDVPGDVEVRVEHIYEEDDPPRALTRRVGGPHDGITAICEVAKLEPVDEHESRAAMHPQDS